MTAFKLGGGETRRGLLLVWHTEDSNQFWATYKTTLQPLLTELHSNNDLSFAIPMAHKPLKHPDYSQTWTNSTLLFFNNTNEAESISQRIIEQIKESSLNDHFISADYMILQKGLDMFYSLSNGIKNERQLKQGVEYVFSKEEARQKYYEEQYKWSGPAMADLHKKGRVGRFIGFEVEKRLYGVENMPAWDLFHIFGFTPWQALKSIPFFKTTWNRIARTAFGEDMTFNKKIEEWNKIRLNVKANGKQNMSLTLQKR